MSFDVNRFDETWTIPLTKRLEGDLQYILSAQQNNGQLNEVEAAFLQCVEQFFRLYQIQVHSGHDIDPKEQATYFDHCMALKTSLMQFAGGMEELRSPRDELMPVATPSPVTTAWQGLVGGLRKAMRITTTVGSTFTVGPGIIKVAIELCTKMPVVAATAEEDPASTVMCSKFLCICLRDKLLAKAGAKGVSMQDQDEKDIVLCIIQSIRAMLYLAVEGYTPEGPLDEESEKRAYDNLVKNAPVDCRQSAAVADGQPNFVEEMQFDLCMQGWCMLCIDFLADERLTWLYLPTVRMLSGILGGGNVRVQNQLLKDLTNVAICPTEVFARTMRKLLRAGSEDLISIQKENDELKFESSGHARDVLQMLTNLTEGGHAGLQNYVVNQTLGDSVRHSFSCSFHLYR